MFKTQFKGINTNSLTYNTTSKYGNVQNNPAGGIGSDWLANNNANGFIIKNPVGISQFVGVDDANGVYNNTSLYGNIRNNPGKAVLPPTVEKMEQESVFDCCLNSSATSSPFRLS